MVMSAGMSRGNVDRLCWLRGNVAVSCRNQVDEVKNIPSKVVSHKIGDDLKQYKNLYLQKTLLASKGKGTFSKRLLTNVFTNKNNIMKEIPKEIQQ